MSGAQTTVAHHVAVAGTGGGVGCTTVTALMFSMLTNRTGRSPVLYDHSGGTLGARLPEGDEVLDLDTTVALHDLGPHAFGAGIELLNDPAALLIVVSPLTPAGANALDELVESVDARFGARGRKRVLGALTPVFGRHRMRGRLARLVDTHGPTAIVPFPADPALAAGGRIPLSRVSGGTRAAGRALTAELANRIALRSR